MLNSGKCAVVVQGFVESSVLFTNVARSVPFPEGIGLCGHYLYTHHGMFLKTSEIFALACSWYSLTGEMEGDVSVCRHVK